MSNNSNTGRAENGRQALFMAIEAVSFALDELRLYLDTHPYCTDALTHYGELEKRRHELVAEYTESYEPLSAYYINTDDGWSWNNEPLAWKGEAY